MISPGERGLSKFFNSVELLFYPSSCRLCGIQLESPDGKLVCNDCWNGLRADRRAVCMSCGRFLAASSEPHVCLTCLRTKPPFSLHRSCARYEGRLKDLILLFKYRGYRILGKNLAAFAYACLKQEEGLWWGLDGLMPVPLHPRRQRARGFNQSLVLARELARLSGLPLLQRQLIKTRFGPPQTSLEARDRQILIKDSFAAGKADKVANRVLLLVDDVFTTGATIRECSSVLLNAGAKEVRALTLAQA